MVEAAPSTPGRLAPAPVVEIDGPTPGTVECVPGTSVLRAMVAAGRSHIAVGCRSGGCGVCRVRVESGEYRVGAMSARQVRPEDAATGVALACRLFPLSDLRVTVLGRRPTDEPTTDQPRSDPTFSTTTRSST